MFFYNWYMKIIKKEKQEKKRRLYLTIIKIEYEKYRENKNFHHLFRNNQNNFFLFFFRFFFPFFPRALLFQQNRTS